MVRLFLWLLAMATKLGELSPGAAKLHRRKIAGRTVTAGRAKDKNNSQAVDTAAPPFSIPSKHFRIFGSSVPLISP
jgi:hypothetical protein